MCPRCLNLSFKRENSWMCLTPKTMAKSEVHRCTICGFLFHQIIEPKELRPLTDDEKSRLRVFD